MPKTTSITLMQEAKSIRDITIKDQRVLIRVDFNVPMDKDFNISDDTRMREALPTINYCIDNEAQSIVLQHCSTSNLTIPITAKSKSKNCRLLFEGGITILEIIKHNFS